MIRNFTKLFNRLSTKTSNFPNNRLFSRNLIKENRLRNLIIIGGATVGFGGIYLNYGREQQSLLGWINTECSTALKSQDNVASLTKKHALFLTIHLKSEANTKEVLKAVTCLTKYIDIISPKDMRDEEDEIHAGVAFGPNFLAKARPSKPALMNFSYHDRKGLHGSMPSTGGDIFIHAKCNEFSKLFELTQSIINNLPANSVDKFEDIYGWVYRNGRDLSGFIDGTENPADEEHRQSVAVNPMTGGSFAITQKWIHKHDVINMEKESVMEGWVGRKRSDSTELKRKATTSHVARMTGGANLEQPKKFEIVRQSQPFGSVCSDSGLFFIGYSSTVDALDFMLDRMVGASEDGLCDDIMRLSTCVKSTYWYFPGEKELYEMSQK